MQIGIVKNYVAHQEETSWKTYSKRHDKGHDIRTDDNRAHLEVLFVQDKIVTDEINKNIQQSIATAAGKVPESLYGNKLTKRRIEKIDKSSDVILQPDLFFAKRI
jgi:hypothetical protein